MIFIFFKPNKPFIKHAIDIKLCALLPDLTLIFKKFLIEFKARKKPSETRSQKYKLQMTFLGFRHLNAYKQPKTGVFILLNICVNFNCTIYN